MNSTDLTIHSAKEATAAITNGSQKSDLPAYLKTDNPLAKDETKCGGNILHSSGDVLADEFVRACLKTPAQERVDQMRKAFESLEQIQCPVNHRFTPGLYTRELFMPAGTLIISKIHKTEHPFIILSGKAAVWIEGVGVKQFEGPYVGITMPGTRRVLYIKEDCRWLTFHPTDKITPDDVEADIILKPDEPVSMDGVDIKLINNLKGV